MGNQTETIFNNDKVPCIHLAPAGNQSVAIQPISVFVTPTAMALKFYDSTHDLEFVQLFLLKIGYTGLVPLIFPVRVNYFGIGVP